MKYNWLYFDKKFLILSTMQFRNRYLLHRFINQTEAYLSKWQNCYDCALCIICTKASELQGLLLRSTHRTYQRMSKKRKTFIKNLSKEQTALEFSSKGSDLQSFFFKAKSSPYVWIILRRWIAKWALAV